MLKETLVNRHLLLNTKSGQKILRSTLSRIESMIKKTTVLDSDEEGYMLFHHSLRQELNTFEVCLDAMYLTRFSVFEKNILILQQIII